MSLVTLFFDDRLALILWLWKSNIPVQQKLAVANKHRSLPTGEDAGVALFPAIALEGISLRTKFLRKSNWIVGACFSTTGALLSLWDVASPSRPSGFNGTDLSFFAWVDWQS